MIVLAECMNAVLLHKGGKGKRYESHTVRDMINVDFCGEGEPKMGLGTMETIVFIN